MNINRVILMGRLTADPELLQTQSGAHVTKFSVAVNRPGKDKGTDFIRCVAFKNTAEFITKYFRKGNLIILYGNIHCDNYTDKDGNKRFSFEVTVNEASFGESRKAADEYQQENGDYTEAAPQTPSSVQVGKTKVKLSAEADDYDIKEIADDDLPF